MIYDVEVEGRRRAVSVRAAPGGGWLVRVDDGEEQLVRGARVDRAEWVLEVGGTRRSVGIFVQGEHAAAQVDGHALRLRLLDPRDRALGGDAGAHEGEIVTPMPGVVVRIAAQPGASVAKGDVLVVVEAMKMENEYRSPIDGLVRAVHVAPGQAVEAHALLVSVEALP